MNIAVYSGSFNPLHIGHLAIMRQMTEVEGYDCVYLIVSPKNPIKDNISSDSGRDRFNNAVKAVRRHPELKVMVDEIELQMPEPHYTIRTLEALRIREPENRFILIIGADNLAGIRRWKDYSRILLEFGVCVFPRSGYDSKEIRQDLLMENPAYMIKLSDAPLVNVSSTQIRNAISEGKDILHLIM